MRKLLFLLSSLVFVLTGKCQSAESVLQIVYNNLNGLHSINYKLTRELNYISENYHQIVNSNVYYDFQSLDTSVGFKYQIDDSASKQVFNGTEEFKLDTKAKTISIDSKPSIKEFNGHAALYNSIITIKNMMPLIFSDGTIKRSIKDTVIDKTSYHLIDLNVGKRVIQSLGKGFDSINRYNITYKIIVDKKTVIPFEMLQTNNFNNDFIRTTFTNIDTNPKFPSEQSWFYSTYLNEYKPAKEVPIPHLLQTDAKAPNWKLNLYNQNKTVSLSELKGKVVLLDFWIKNCGPYIESVPQLNEWQQKFNDKSFKIISINSYDSKEDVKWFCNKHQVNYDVVLNGESVAEKYGVSGFPTFLILDKNGKVIYSKAGYGKTSESEIEKIIEKAL